MLDFAFSTCKTDLLTNNIRVYRSTSQTIINNMICYLIHKTFNMSGNVWYGVDHESKFPGKAEGGEG